VCDRRTGSRHLDSASSCPAKAGHPVNADLTALSDNSLVTGSPAFAGDDDRSKPTILALSPLPPPPLRLEGRALGRGEVAVSGPARGERQPAETAGASSE